MAELLRYFSAFAILEPRFSNLRISLAAAFWRAAYLFGLAAFAPLAAVDAQAAISVGTGNLFEKFVDYAPEDAGRLGFIRYYNCLGIQYYGPLAPLGIQWRSNYDNYLVFLPNAPVVMAERADGQVVHFKISNGVGGPDSDVDLTLVQIGDAWVLTDRDGNKETYGPPDSTGRARVLTIKAPDGYTQTLSYNTAKQLISVTDSRKRTITLAYDGNSLSSVATGDGLTMTYGYTSTGRAVHNDRLASVSYSTTPGEDQTYLYENETFTSALTGILNAKGNRVATWTYDQFGRATSSQLAGGANLTTVTYDKDSRGNPVNTVTEAHGKQTVYKFTIMQRVPKVTEIDWPATPVHAAWAEQFAYDDRGYLVKKTDSNGNVTNILPKTQTLSP